MGANVAVTFDTIWPGARGLGRENSLVDLQVPVLATLAEMPL